MALEQVDEETEYYPGYERVPDCTPVETGDDSQSQIAFTEEAGLLPSESPIPSSLHHIVVDVTPDPQSVASTLQPPTQRPRMQSLPQLSITPSAFSPPSKANKEALLDDPTFIYLAACISIVVPIVGLLALLCFAVCIRLGPRQRTASYVLVLGVLIGLAIDATIGYYWNME